MTTFKELNKFLDIITQGNQDTEVTFVVECKNLQTELKIDQYIVTPENQCAVKFVEIAKGK